VSYGEILSQALAPLQSITHASPRSRFAARAANSRSPLPRFGPPQRLANRAEPLTPGGFQPTGYVAPPGFLTLSTLCSPRDLLGLFHPSSALGVFPSRPYSLPAAVRPLGRRSPPEVRPACLGERPLQGLARQPEPGPRAWGLARLPRRCPLGIHPLQGFLPSTTVCRFRDALSPLALSRLGRTLTSPPVPQGLFRRGRNRSLSRSMRPSWSSAPRRSSR
jgi:hypothetical protein